MQEHIHTISIQPEDRKKHKRLPKSNGGYGKRQTTSHPRNSRIRHYGQDYWRAIMRKKISATHCIIMITLLSGCVTTSTQEKAHKECHSRGGEIYAASRTTKIDGSAIDDIATYSGNIANKEIEVFPSCKKGGEIIKDREDDVQYVDHFYSCCSVPKK